MRFSVWPSSQRPWHEVVDIVGHCERRGWHAAYFADHFMPNDPEARASDGPLLECLAVVSALAARTSRIRIGSLVLGNLYRHPAVVANAAATLDRISDGRFTLGLGAGWQANEHAAYGIDLCDPKTRLDRLEEACEVITSLLRNPRTNVAGRHYRISDAPCEPKPVQEPLPLLLGGGGEQRTMRVAARFADHWNAWTTPDVFRHKSEVLDRHCVDVGRDPAAIERSTQALVFLSTDESALAPVRDQTTRMPRLVGTPREMTEQLAAYQAVGVDEFVVPDWTMGPGREAVATLDLFWDEVAAHFR